MTSFGWTDWVSMMGSFLVVLGLLIFTLLMIKKMGPKIGISGGKNLKVLEVQNLGARQKLMLLNVNQRQILVGISAGEMTKLGEFPISPIRSEDIKDEDTDSSIDEQQNQNDGLFSGVLSRVLKK
ncbi:MAG: flagellar biosynthetic protein FliO [Porticoccaceae bacterium]|nr:flagellar biosynthetic protein FliO [Porticoccaceae bacterium]